MYEEATSSARSGIQVFVAAPDGGIHAPIVELERNIADCVGEVPDDEDGVTTCKRGDGGDIEELTSVVLNSWEEDESRRGGVFSNYGENLVCCES